MYHIKRKCYTIKQQKQEMQRAILFHKSKWTTIDGRHLHRHLISLSLYHTQTMQLSFSAQTIIY